jgi:hypothetical protein
MARPQVRETLVPAGSQGQASPSPELRGASPTRSPALTLQEELARRAVLASTPEIEKWSPRNALVLIVTVSAALWMALAIAAAEAAQLIA